MFREVQMVGAHSVQGAVQGHGIEAHHPHTAALTCPGSRNGRQPQPLTWSLRHEHTGRGINDGGDTPDRHRPIPVIGCQDNNISTHDRDITDERAHPDDVECDPTLCTQSIKEP